MAQIVELAELILKTISVTEGEAFLTLARAFNDLARALGTAEPDAIRRVLSEGCQSARERGDTIIRPDLVDLVLTISFDHVYPTLIERVRASDSEVARQVLCNPFLHARIVNTVLRHQPSPDRLYQVARAATKDVASFLGYRPTPVLEGEERTRPRPAERTVAVPIYLSEIGVAFHKYERLVASWVECLQKTPAELLHQGGVSLESLKEIAIDPRDYDFLHPAWRRPGHVFGEYDPDQLSSKGTYERYVVRRWLLEAADEFLRQDEESPVRVYEVGVGLTATMLLGATITGPSPTARSATEELATRVSEAANLREALYRYHLENAPQDIAGELREERVTRKQPFAAFRIHVNRYSARLRAAQIAIDKLSIAAVGIGNPDYMADLLSRQQSRFARYAGMIRHALFVSRLRAAASDLGTALSEVRRAYSTLLDGLETGDLGDPWCIIGFSGNYPLGPAPQDAIPDPRVPEVVRAVDRILEACAYVGTVALLNSDQDHLADAIRVAEDLLEWWGQFGVNAIADIATFMTDVPVDCRRYDLTLDALNAIFQEKGDLVDRLVRLNDTLTPETAFLLASELLRRGRLDEAEHVILQWLGGIRPFGSEGDDIFFSEVLYHWLYRALLEDPSLPVKRRVAVWRRFHGFVEKLLEYGEPWLGFPEDASFPVLSSFYERIEDWVAPQFAAVTGPYDSSEELEDVGNVESSHTDTGSWNSGSEGGGTGTNVPGGELDDFLTLSQEVVAAMYAHIDFMAGLGTVLALGAVLIPDLPRDLREEQEQAFLRWTRIANRCYTQLVHFVESTTLTSFTEASGFGENVGFADLGRLINLLGSLVTPAISVSYLLASAVERLVARLNPEDRRKLEPLGVWWAQQIADLRALLIEGRSLRGAQRSLDPAIRLCHDFARQIAGLAKRRGDEASRTLMEKTFTESLKDLVFTLVYTGNLREARLLVNTVLMTAVERGPALFDEEVGYEREVFEVWCRSVGHQLGKLVPVNGEKEDSESFERFRRVSRCLIEDAYRTYQRLGPQAAAGAASWLEDNDVWQNVQQFIQEFGGDLFTPQFMDPQHLLGILVGGSRAYLEQLANVPISERPQVATEYSRAPDHTQTRMARTLALIVKSLYENYDIYSDYNITTAYSDYGNLLYILLDFLRVRDKIRVFDHLAEPFRAFYQGALETAPVDPAEWFQLPEDLQAAGRMIEERLEAVEKRYGVSLGSIRITYSFAVRMWQSVLFVEYLSSLILFRAPITERPGVTDEWYRKVLQILQEMIETGDPRTDWVSEFASENARIARRPYAMILDARHSFASRKEKAVSLAALEALCRQLT